MATLLDRSAARDPFALRRGAQDATQAVSRRLESRAVPSFGEASQVLEGIQTPGQQLGDQFKTQAQSILRRQGTDGLGELNAKELISKPISAAFEQLRPKLRQAGQAVQGGMSRILPEGKFNVTQGFGVFNPALYSGITKGARHLGLDIGVPQGTQLRLPVSGSVEIGIDPRGFGAWVRVKGDDGATLRFSHLSQINPAIARAAKTGEKIAAGTIFGLSGGLPRTKGAGNTTGAHLDVTARQGGKFIDPLKLESVRRALFAGG